MPLTLQILHASDLEGGVDAIDDAPRFAAVVEALETDAANQNIPSILLSAGDNYLPGPFFAAAADRSVRSVLQDVYSQFFGLPAGTLDNIRESVGRIDISNANIIGFDASAVGNHEFDAGTSTFEDIIATDIRGSEFGDVRWLGAQFPYLTSNLDFTGSNLEGLFTSDILPNTAFQSTPDDLTAAGDAPKLAPATIIERDGELIGVVGATTPLQASITSVGDVTVRNPGAGSNDMAALAAIVQPVIDRLLAQGVNKIVTVTHLQQFQLEEELVPLLSGVDVAIAGGSDTIVADNTDRLRSGDVATENYPVLTQNRDGDPAIVLSTDGEYAYVGRLVLEFDDNGVINTTSIDPNISGAYATDDQGVNELWSAILPGEDPFASGTKGGTVQELTSSVVNVVNTNDAQVFGTSAAFIEGRRSQVRTEETTLGNLTADANLFAAQQVDSTVQVSIKNGGGIRAAIGEIIGDSGDEVAPQANPQSGKPTGGVSRLDIENTLRFNNQLSLLTLTATQLQEIIEHGVAATAPGATPGQFPQVGGLSFSFDPNLPSGQRVQSLVILDDRQNIADVVVENGQLVGDPGREIRIVTLNFLADGGDSYPFPDDAAANRVDLVPADASADFNTFGTEQKALADFLAANFSQLPFYFAEVGSDRDTRIQNLSVRADTVLAQQFEDLDDSGNTIMLNPGELAGLIGGLRGFGGDDVITGSSDNEVINGNGGNDQLFGEGGDDVLLGGRGNDALSGGDGNDLLSGDFGQDTLTGGAGSDIFLLRFSDAIASGNGAPDEITDFVVGEDVIGLTSNITFADLFIEGVGDFSVVRLAETGQELGIVRGIEPASLNNSFANIDLGIV
jgi:2',3'-cyclic-nucleotide 2'-phosphodiesterase (5'-nucleotidase family)